MVISMAKEIAKTDSKPWYLSKGVWGGVIASVVGLLGMMGLVFPAQFAELLAADVVTTAEAVVVAMAGVLAIVGRLKAVKKIGK